MDCFSGILCRRRLPHACSFYLILKTFCHTRIDSLIAKTKELKHVYPPPVQSHHSCIQTEFKTQFPSFLPIWTAPVEYCAGETTTRTFSPSVNQSNDTQPPHFPSLPQTTTHSRQRLPPGSASQPLAAAPGRPHNRLKLPPAKPEPPSMGTKVGDRGEGGNYRLRILNFRK